MLNARLDEAQAGIKLTKRNINYPRYADDTNLMAGSEEGLNSLLMKVKEKSGKIWFKTQYSKNQDHGIWSHHFMASRWGNNGKKDRLYFLRLQNHWSNSMHGDCNHEMKRCFLLGRKAMSNLDSIL